MSAPVFDYSVLSSNTAENARAAAAAIRSQFNSDAREIGERLIEVKSSLPHGKFSHWVQTELQISQRAAQRYMNLCEFLRLSLIHI